MTEQEMRDLIKHLCLGIMEEDIITIRNAFVYEGKDIRISAIEWNKKRKKATKAKGIYLKCLGCRNCESDLNQFDMIIANDDELSMFMTEKRKTGYLYACPYCGTVQFVTDDRYNEQRQIQYVAKK